MCTLTNTLARSASDTAGKAFQENAWGLRHSQAWQYPRGPEVPIVLLFKALATYADTHHARYESKVGDDGFLGPEWLAIAKSIRALLNGELGRLDGGTLDGLLFDLVEAAGFSRDDL